MDETAALILTGFTFFIFGAAFLQRPLMNFYDDAFGVLSSLFFFPTLIAALFFGWIPLIEIVFNKNLLELFGETESLVNSIALDIANTEYNLLSPELKVTLIVFLIVTILIPAIIYVKALLRCPRGRKFGVGISMCVCFFGIMMKISLIISVGILFLIFLGSLPSVLVFWVPGDKD